MFLNSVLSSFSLTSGIKTFTPVSSASIRKNLEDLYKLWLYDDNVFTRTALLRYVAKRRYNPDWPFLEWFVSKDCTEHLYFPEWFFALASSMSELDEDHFFELNNPVLKNVYFLGRWSRSFVKRGGAWKYYCLEFGKQEYSTWKHAQWLWIIRQNHRLNIPLLAYAEDIIQCIYPEMGFFFEHYQNLSWLDMAYSIEGHRAKECIKPIDF